MLKYYRRALNFIVDCVNSDSNMLSLFAYLVVFGAMISMSFRFYAEIQPCVEAVQFKTSWNRKDSIISNFQ